MSYAKIGSKSPRGAPPAASEEDDDEEQQASSSSSAPPGEKDALMTRPAQPSETSTERKSTKFIKLTILVAVTLQNTGYALVRRYSRGHLKERYSTSSALLVMELVKLILSMWMVVYGGQASDVPSGSAIAKYSFLIAHSWKMVRVPRARVSACASACSHTRSCALALLTHITRLLLGLSRAAAYAPSSRQMVPAVIYLVMNILGFVALGHLDASTFSIVAQMKVFTTAIFSVIILQRRLHLRKWRALTSLTLGVVLISHEAMPKKATGAANAAHCAPSPYSSLRARHSLFAAWTRDGTPSTPP